MTYETALQERLRKDQERALDNSTRQEREARYEEEHGMGSGAKFEPVGCVLQETLNVGSAGHHYIGWSAMYNNPIQFVGIDEIPDGLGLSFTVDSVPTGFTALEDGTWSFSFSSNTADDANFKAWFAGMLGASGFVQIGGGQFATHTMIGKLVAGDGFIPEIVTATAAAAGSSFPAVVRAVIVRLG